MQTPRSKRLALQERTNTLASSVKIQPKSEPKGVCFTEDAPISTTSMVTESSRHELSTGTAVENAPIVCRPDPSIVGNNRSTQSTNIEDPPQTQTQINLLHSATALFNARLEHAMHEVEHLRALLADRSLHPADFNAIQQKRLVQERFLLSAQGLAGRLDQYSDSEPPTRGGSKQRADLEAHQSSQSKLSANQIEYRQHSQEKTSIRGSALQRAPRELKPNRTISPARPRHNGLLVLSLASRYPPPPPAKSKFRPIPPRDRAVDPSSRAVALEYPPPLTPSPLPGSGTAKIWRDSDAHPTNDILADLVVSIPDYVTDLLAEFDSAVPNGPPKLQDPSISTLPVPPHITPSKSRNTIAGTTPQIKPKLSKATFKVPPSPSAASWRQRSETPSSPSRSTTPQMPGTPSKKRLSALLAFPEALSSRISLRSSMDNSSSSSRAQDNRSSSRFSWRLSSPPSSFRSGLLSFAETTPTATPKAKRVSIVKASDIGPPKALQPRRSSSRSDRGSVSAESNGCRTSTRSPSGSSSPSGSHLAGDEENESNAVTPARSPSRATLASTKDDGRLLSRLRNRLKRS